MLPIPHSPHRNLHTIQHPLLHASPSSIPFPNRRTRKIPPSHLEFAVSHRPPDPQDFVRPQRDPVRNAPHEAVAGDARLHGVGVQAGHDVQEGVGGEEVGGRKGEDHAARKVAAANDGCGEGGRGWVRVDGDRVVG